MNRKDYIKFRTYIVMAKRVYAYVNVNKEGYEGEYVKLSKKDLIDRLDNIHIQNKHNIEDYGEDAVIKEIDTDKFTFVTKDDKRFSLKSEWLGRPEEVLIN